MRSRSSLPSLSVLRMFAAAARHQSYTMAGEELGVTQGAISRQVRELEDMIGVPLFRRVGRAVRLTDAGRSLADELDEDLDRLRATISRAVAAGEKATILSIAVLPTFAARWLMPRLPDFRDRYPGIELSFASRTEPFDLVRERFDLAIHFGRPDWPGAQLTPLCPEDLVAVASPDLIRKQDIERPDDLFRAPLLHLTSRPHIWERYRAALGGAGRTALPGMQFDQFAMIIAAAAGGLGAALLPTYLIEAELSSGALVRVGEVPSDDGESYHIATPLGASSQEATVFSNWIRRQVSIRPRRPTSP